MARQETTYTIDDVSRDTGIGKDTLRVWERRYGFPAPLRGVRGERRYHRLQLARLRTIRRLLDQGYRPHQVVVLDDAGLSALSQRGGEPATERGIDELIALPPEALEAALRVRLSEVGVEAFISDCVTPLLNHVGLLWSRGELAIFHEHQITETVKNIVVETMARRTLPTSAGRLLLAIPPGERHTLGLLMVELLLRERGMQTINLGSETPLDQLLLAIESYRPELVALSFSGHLSRRSVSGYLAALRAGCPASLPIVAGGGGIDSVGKFPPDIHPVSTLKELDALLKELGLTIPV